MSSFETAEGGQEKDYHDMQVASEALVAADPAELARLAQSLGWDEKRVALESAYAQLRARVHDESEHEFDERQRTRPDFDEDEKLLGAYREAIEPQVRAAVFELRRKGYNTYESGFYGFGAFQRIGFSPALVEPAKIPSELVQRWAGEGVTFESKRDGVELHFDRLVPLTIITQLWNEVAAALPDQGTPAGPSVIARRVAERDSVA